MNRVDRHRILAYGVVVLISSVMCCAAGPGTRPITGLIISYKCSPAQRPDLHRYMSTDAIARFADLRRRGILMDFQVFFSRYVDNESWDAMLVLLFRHAADIGRWHDVELTSPAGLSERGLADVRVVSTTPVTLVRSSLPSPNSAGSIFLIIPYRVMIPITDYLAYFDAYVVPQLDGWRDEKALAHYDLFLAQYPAGRAWSSMLVLRYADENALANRAAIIAKVRDRLRNNPSWKTYADGKAALRSEQQAVVSDEVQTSPK